MTITSEQRSMMRNALGLLWSKTSYRNYFAAHPEAPAAAAWRDLVAKGYAINDGIPDHSSRQPLTYFAVTVAGCRAIGVDPAWGRP